MGIKDNFSQAVKELWKKDGLEENGENKTDRAAQPTELDRYLSGQEGIQQQQPQAAQPAPAQAPQSEMNTYQFGANQQPQVPSPAPQPEGNPSGVPLETPYYRNQPAPEQQNNAAQPQPQNQAASAQGYNGGFNGGNTQAGGAGFGGGNGFVGNGGGNGFAGNGGNGGNGGYVPPAAPGKSVDAPSDTDEVTVISRNTIIDGNVRSLANMQVDGNIKGNVETTRDIEMSGKVVGDITCNNANMNSAAMQGNMNLKGKIRMDRDTILIGDLTSQYADVNGRVRGKLEIGGKAELKRDAIVFGDINASTIAVTDGAIIQGYVNTTFLSKEDSRSVFPEAISFDSKNGTDKA